MSRFPICRLAPAAILALCLAVLPAARSVAAPSTGEVSADRARLGAAVKRLEAARKRSAAIDARVSRTLQELDAVVSEQDRLYALQDARVDAMYRSGATAELAILLTSATIQDFSQRWDMLLRWSAEDAARLAALRTARAKAGSAAASLMTLQAEAARAADDAAREAAAARAELASDAAALRAYEAKARGVARRPSAPRQARTGSGPWLTGVASHYSPNFSGRWASGAAIGPYSMIVAHKTLPFHTLVEIEYNGRRAVASVEDRGPFTPGRTFDLGPGVVRVLGFSGVHTVRYRIIR